MQNRLDAASLDTSCKTTPTASERNDDSVAEKGFLATDNTTAPQTFTSNIISYIRTSGNDHGPPPDGGLQAWSQILWAHLTITSTWGYVTAFGVFQTYYTQMLDETPSTISWIGSVQVFFLFLVGTLSGRASDAGYFKLIWGIGALLVLLGVFMASISTQYWQLFLSQGLCLGIGSGLMFCPVLSLISTYFAKNRALAVGISATGSSTGGLVFPAVLEQLLPRIGFPWTMRVLGFLTLAMLVPPFIFFKPRVPPRTGGPVVEWEAFKDPSYTLFGIGVFFNFWGLYVAFFYIGSFARDIIGVDHSTSINLLLIMNGAGMPSRIIPNLLADRSMGPMNLLIPVMFFTAITLYGWIGVTQIKGLYAFSVIYGIFAASLQSLFPASLTSLTEDFKKIGVRTGMVLSIISFACLTGSPIAGALVQHGDGNYLYAQCFAASSMICGCMLVVLARVWKTGWVLRARI
ncbi:major facilitator superfamily domain-containing protein [Aspergillus avenaceus]|uniref:Major facilitator superfamily domain-containing protein n=1 Tax=Aspergillus avenaceus TaxID=36643 RepID=A0A5N6TPS5_ASPAV|nr:major facilitator superfamily domain-containing protein [Aspergillus avenaceus]